MREEKNKEFKILEDAKNIFSQAIGTKIDTSQPILFQLVDVVQKFNKDMDGQEKLLQRVEKKFENKVLEKITKKIYIYQVELSTSLNSLETLAIMYLLYLENCVMYPFSPRTSRKS